MGIHLIKDMQDFYTENYKNTDEKKIKDIWKSE